MNFTLKMFIFFIFINCYVKFLVFFMRARHVERDVDFGVDNFGRRDSGGVTAVANTTVAVTDSIGQ
jgi:hypothetical protein